MTLRRRLALVLGAVLLLPLATVGVLVAVLVPAAAGDAADDRLRAAARASAVSLADRCTELGETARVLALQAGAAVEPPPPQAAGPVPPAVTAALAEALATRPRTSGAVVDAAGRVIAAAGPRADIALDAGRSCAAGYLGGGGARPAALVQSVAVTAQGSTGWAVVSAPLDADAVQSLRRDLGITGGLVLTTGTTVLAATVAPEVAEQVAVATATVAAGDPFDVAGHRVVADPGGRGLGLHVLAVETAPRASAVVGSVVGLLAVAALAAAVTVAVLVRRLTEPLLELTRVADRLGAGDLQARVQVDRDDEVGHLGRAFNAMADELVRDIRTARDQQAALEDSFEHFGRALGRTHDLDGLVTTLLEACRSASRAATGGAWLGATATAARLVAGGGELLDDITDLAGQAVELGRPVTERSRVERTPMAAYPLMHGDEVLGAVVVADPDGGDFSPEGLAALSAMSRQAGTAVHNVLAHRETARLSVTDPLTGAGNFRHLSTTLAREVERATRFSRPLSVLMIDIDHFKRVNDDWGHQRGDTVLRELARRLGDCVREVDTVARYGGEEFALVLPETDQAGGELVALRVVESIGREEFTAPDLPPLAVTVSAGLATFPTHALSAGDVLRAADQALYAAKRAGRNQWRCAPPLGASAGTSPGSVTDAGLVPG